MKFWCGSGKKVVKRILKKIFCKKNTPDGLPSVCKNLLQSYIPGGPPPIRKKLNESVKTYLLYIIDPRMMLVQVQYQTRANVDLSLTYIKADSGRSALWQRVSAVTLSLNEVTHSIPLACWKLQSCSMNNFDVLYHFQLPQKACKSLDEAIYNFILTLSEP